MRSLKTALIFSLTQVPKRVHIDYRSFDRKNKPSTIIIHCHRLPAITNAMRMNVNEWMKKHNIIKNLHKSHKTPPTIRLIYISDFQYRKCKILQLEYISYFLYFPSIHIQLCTSTGSGMFSNKVISLQRNGKALELRFSPPNLYSAILYMLLTVSISQ